MLPSAAWLSRLAGIPAAGAAARLVAGIAEETILIAGVADAQLGGTDNFPTTLASPTPADTVLLRLAQARSGRHPQPGSQSRLRDLLDRGFPEDLELGHTEVRPAHGVVGHGAEAADVGEDPEGVLVR